MRQDMRSQPLPEGMNRRAVLAGAAGLALLAATPALAQTAAPGAYMGLKVIGNPDAPVTIEEFASLACSHCADFHVKILPTIKKDFLDTGKAKLVLHPFVLNAPGLRAEMLARCAGEARYPAMVDILFKSQAQWLNQNFMGELAKIARLAGFTQAQFDACMQDKQLQNFLAQSQFGAQQKHNINSTPTFILNNGAARVEGAKEKELIGALEKLGAKR